MLEAPVGVTMQRAVFRVRCYGIVPPSSLDCRGDKLIKRFGLPSMMESKPECALHGSEWEATDWLVERNDWYNDRILETFISSPDIDKQNDKVPTSAIKNALDFYMKYGVYSWKHDEMPIGLPLAYKIEKDKVKLKIGIHDSLPMHDKCWDEIKELGKLGSSSIRGEALDRKVVCDSPSNCYNLIDKLGLWSVSWVGDNPANSEAKVTFVSVAKGYSDKCEVHGICKDCGLKKQGALPGGDGGGGSGTGGSPTGAGPGAIIPTLDEMVAQMNALDAQLEEGTITLDAYVAQKKYLESLMQQAEDEEPSDLGEAEGEDETFVETDTFAETAEEETAEGETDIFAEGETVIYIPPSEKKWSDALEGTIASVFEKYGNQYYRILAPDGITHVEVMADYVKAPDDSEEETAEEETADEDGPMSQVEWEEENPGGSYNEYLDYVGEWKPTVITADDLEVTETVDQELLDFAEQMRIWNAWEVSDRAYGVVVWTNSITGETLRGKDRAKPSMPEAPGVYKNIHIAYMGGQADFVNDLFWPDSLDVTEQDIEDYMRYVHGVDLNEARARAEGVPAFNYEETDWDALYEELIRQNEERLNKLEEQKDAGEITQEEYDEVIADMTEPDWTPRETPTLAEAEAWKENYQKFQEEGYRPPVYSQEQFEADLASGAATVAEGFQYDYNFGVMVDAYGNTYDYQGNPLNVTYDEMMNEAGYVYDPYYQDYVPQQDPYYAPQQARMPTAPYGSGYAPLQFYGGGAGGGFEEEIADERPRIILKDGKYCIVHKGQVKECFKTKEEAIKKLSTLGL